MTYYFTTLPDLAQLRQKDTIILDCAHPDLYDIHRWAEKMDYDDHRYENTDILYIHPKRENI
jgi:hypothetical protein